MTAEIAILNRTALALAADSAATLTGPSGSKTFDSAEKIFELTRAQPIALMLFNNAQFMGVPFDVLARGYRADRADEMRFDRLIDVWPSFKEYLLAFSRSVDDETAHLGQHAFTIFKRVAEGAYKLRMDAMLKAFGKGRKSPPPESMDPTAFVIALAKQFQKRHDADQLSDFLSSQTLEDFERHYGDRLDLVARKAFNIHLDSEALSALRALMFSVVKSKARSPGYTGVVFGGFGISDIFPTLQSIELDGIYLGELRVLSTETVDIDRRTETAAVIPFAQKDMPQRFIYGLDDGLQRHIEAMVGGIVDEIISAKPRTYKSGSGNAIKDAAKRRVNAALEEFKQGSESK